MSRLATAALAAAVVVAGSSGGAAAAPGCAAGPVQAAFRSFVAAYDAGGYAQLDALFAQPPQFRWYSSALPGPRRTAAARNRGTLLAYFRARHRQRDRLRLVSFRFTGASGDYGNFTFTARRSTRDHRRGAWFRLAGKGAAVCTPPSPYVEHAVQLAVLSLGGPAAR